MWSGGSLCHKGELEVVDDAIDHGEDGEEGDDTHFPLAFGTDQGVGFIHLADHGGPASAWDLRALLLDEEEYGQAMLSLAHLTPMSIGIEAEVTNHDLALIGYVGGCAGDELQIIHPLLV
jgi:hypothetical protein